MIRHALAALACLTIATCIVAAVLSASGVAS